MIKQPRLKKLQRFLPALNKSSFVFLKKTKRCQHAMLREQDRMPE